MLVVYTRKGLRLSHRSIVAALAEAPQFANFWLLSGNTACVSNVCAFLGEPLVRLSAAVRISVVRADSGSRPRAMIAALRAPVQTLCRHDDPARILRSAEPIQLSHGVAGWQNAATGGSAGRRGMGRENGQKVLAGGWGDGMVRRLNFAL